MSLSVISLDHTPAQPWKNGGGTTRELLCWPSPTDWSLRISVADITRDGAFSAYPGVVRYFAVLTGQGVLLGDSPERITANMQPVCFDGKTAPMCQLIDGPSRDLNVMTRGGCVIHAFQMQSLAAHRPTALDLVPSANFIALFTVSQCALAFNGRSYIVPPMSLCTVPPSPNLAMTAMGSGALDANLYTLCATLQS